MGRFIEDEGSRLFPDVLQTATAGTGLGRQEPLEHETIRRQASRRQCRDQRAGSGDGHHADTGGTSLAHQVKTWIGNQRRTGIGDQRHVIPCLQPRQEAPTLVAFVVLVTGGQGRLDTEVLQQTGRVTRVLGRDQLHLPQHPQGPRRDVIEITDRRCNHIERAGRIASGGRKGHKAPRERRKARIVSRFTGPTSRLNRALGTIAPFSNEYRDR